MPLKLDSEMGGGREWKIRRDNDPMGIQETREWEERMRSRMCAKTVEDACRKVN